jgi:hypothetical protein
MNRGEGFVLAFDDNQINLLVFYTLLKEGPIDDRISLLDERIPQSIVFVTVKPICQSLYLPTSSNIFCSSTVRLDSNPFLVNNRLYEKNTVYLAMLG